MPPAESTDAEGQDEKDDRELEALSGDGLNGLGQQAFELAAERFDDLAIVVVPAGPPGGDRPVGVGWAPGREVHGGRRAHRRHLSIGVARVRGDRRAGRAINIEVLPAGAVAARGGGQEELDRLTGA